MTTNGQLDEYLDIMTINIVCYIILIHVELFFLLINII